MARQSIINDRAAHICWLYLHGGLTEQANITVHDIAHFVCPEKYTAITMILEIAYREGYAKSALMNDMSEVTYKKKKKRIRDMLVQEVNLYEGRRANNEQAEKGRWEE